MSTPAKPTALPNKDGTFKFAVLGDFGTGDRTQYELAQQMAALHQRFKYELVALVGDNLYGSERPQDFKKKFEEPYKPLIDAGVKFYASLGNHDSREQRYYKLFNMDGKLYYTFNPKADVAVLHRSRAPIQSRNRSGGSRRNYRRRAATGRSPSSTTRSTRPASGTAQTFACARCSSLSS